jgi:hypothetical protein
MSGPDTICGAVFRRPAKGGADMPVELWLREALACAYDDVLSEKLPEDWLAIIARAPAAGEASCNP